MFISFEFHAVPTMRVTNKPQTEKCMICYENFGKVDLQSFQIEHSLHLACRDCIKHLDSLASTEKVTSPYCRVPVDRILYN